LLVLIWSPHPAGIYCAGATYDLSAEEALMICARRRVPFVVVMAWAGALVACAHVDAGRLTDAPTGAQPNTTPGVSRAQEALDGRVSEYHVDAMPLNEALRLLHEKTGVNMVVDWAALDDAGVSKDVPVSMFVREVPAGNSSRRYSRKRGAGFLICGMWWRGMW
jgi:hypothetical protein